MHIYAIRTASPSLLMKYSLSGYLAKFTNVSLTGAPAAADETSAGDAGGAQRWGIAVAGLAPVKTKAGNGHIYIDVWMYR